MLQVIIFVGLFVVVAVVAMMLIIIHECCYDANYNS